ncbi:MAG: hypothetical protein M3Y08_08450 [Fibrobacterota bacterium]|nr:hypothetical protein [Fibrobacterota bacterium]
MRSIPRITVSHGLRLRLRFVLASAAACALVLAAASPAFSHPDFDATLKHFEWVLRKHPGNVEVLASRAWLLLEHDSSDRVELDIRRMIADPALRPEGLQIQARHHLMKGECDQALSSILGSMRQGGETVARMRLLSEIRTRMGDVNGGVTALERTWALGREEEDFLSLLALRRSNGLPIGILLAAGLKEYPGHPAAVTAIFNVCASGSETGRANRSCLEISARGYREWWPASVDWRLKHAGLLLKAGRMTEAETLLLESLDMLDAEGGSQAGTEGAREFRKAIFALLEKTAESPLVVGSGRPSPGHFP